MHNDMNVIHVIITILTWSHDPVNHQMLEKAEKYQNGGWYWMSGLDALKVPVSHLT